MTPTTFARLSIAIVYVWFGALKLFNLSPASELVSELTSKLLPFVPIPTFMIMLGLAEICIGIAFLIPKLTKVATAVFALHIATTFLPLVFLPQLVWTGWLVPNLEGQYILKNLVLIALVWSLYKSHQDRSSSL